MIIRTLDDVTFDALAVMNGTEDPRLRDIMASLVKHLHAFVCEVRLTEPGIPSGGGHPERNGQTELGFA
jgi:hypothetical protein